jgi:hypothetical protein
VDLLAAMRVGTRASVLFYTASHRRCRWYIILRPRLDVAGRHNRIATSVARPQARGEGNSYPEDV